MNKQKLKGGYQKEDGFRSWGKESGPKYDQPLVQNDMENVQNKHM